MTASKCGRRPVSLTVCGHDNVGGRGYYVSNYWRQSRGPSRYNHTAVDLDYEIIEPIEELVFGIKAVVGVVLLVVLASVLW